MNHVSHISCLHTFYFFVSFYFIFLCVSFKFFYSLHCALFLFPDVGLSDSVFHITFLPHIGSGFFIINDNRRRCTISSLTYVCKPSTHIQVFTSVFLSLFLVLVHSQHRFVTHVIALVLMKITYIFRLTQMNATCTATILYYYVNIYIISSLRIHKVESVYFSYLFYVHSNWTKKLTYVHRSLCILIFVTCQRLIKMCKFDHRWHWIDGINWNSPCASWSGFSMWVFISPFFALSRFEYI